MFNNEINDLINAFSGKYILLDYHTNNYLEEGFCIDVKATFPQRLTQKAMYYRSAKAYIDGKYIRVKGFLNDVAWILKSISG